MQSRYCQWLAAFCLLCAGRVSAAVLYVDAGSTHPIPPYATWSTAAAVLQDAVDAAKAGDLVLVTNGLYAAGGRRVSQADITNRVVLTNAITLQSVNGPAVTTIQGYRVSGTTSLTNAIRCVQLGSNAVLSGFTLTNGSAGTGNYVNGGGVFGPRYSGVVSNCVLTGNYAAGAGGGVARCVLVNCVLRGNQGGGGGAAWDSILLSCLVTNNLAGWAAGMLDGYATNCLFAANHATNYGGATGFATLVNCTVVSNSLQAGYSGNGGGSYKDTLFNCIVYGNTAPNGSNYYTSTLAYCCSAPLPSGDGNIDDPPLFNNPAAGDFHLQSTSPCINAGNNAYIRGTGDLDGNPRTVAGTVDLGAYEFQNPVSRISYAWLQQYNLPIDANTDTTDADGDSLNTWQEWVAGTDPTNPASALKLLAASNSAAGLTLNWQSVSGKTYFLQRSSSLLWPPAFSALQSNIVGQAGTTSFADTNAPGVGPCFYRVGVQ